MNSYAASSFFSLSVFGSPKPAAHARYPSLSGWYVHAMPIERTLVTAGDHMDWITVSPEAIRFTLSLKSFQNARNWPDFLASVSTFMVMSISARVILPLSGYL